ncbi:MAG: hypothetical protein NVSMB49_02030 [Ktedonobacteraceae bacterium]
MSSMFILLDRCRQQLLYLMFSFIAVSTIVLPLSSVHAASHAKPALTLNLQQGPLGVALTLKGKNFHTGQATLSYVDAQNTSGTFVTPSENSVQVQHDGTFTARDLVLPESGQAGIWKIVVTDSAKTIARAQYRVLATPGEQSAATPSILINPTNGKAGDAVAISGNNWLPQGTHIKVAYLDTNYMFVPLNTSLVSDKNGMVTGAIRIPTQLDSTQTTLTIIVTDTTEALKAQTSLTVLSLSPTPTPALNPTPTKSLSTEIAPSTNDPGKFSFTMSTATLELVLLAVGGTLGLAALMLILFLLPWRKPRFHEDVTMPHRPYRRW